MYFHNSLIPRGAYFLLPLESKQEATSGWNFTKCISGVKVNQSKVKNIHFKMGISIFNFWNGNFKCTVVPLHFCIWINTVYIPRTQNSRDRQMPWHIITNAVYKSVQISSVLQRVALLILHFQRKWNWMLLIICSIALQICSNYSMLE